MNRKANKLLFDMLSCIEDIESYFPEKESILALLKTDRKTLRAVERNIEIIGEATKKLLKIDPSIGITDANDIIGARNFIAYDYDSVSHIILSRIIIENFPILKREVQELMGKE
jgi:uncharacterized protein with HEPN domain